MQRWDQEPDLLRKNDSNNYAWCPTIMQWVNTNNNDAGKVSDIRSCITAAVIRMNYGSEYPVCQEFVQLIASVSLYVYVYLCRDKRINDAEEYIMAVKQRGGERKVMWLRVAQSRRVIKVALCMWMSLLIARRIDTVFITQGKAESMHT